MRRNGRAEVGRGARLVLAGLLCLAGQAPAAAQAQEEVVKLGDLLTLSNAGIYIAIDKGYFKEQGIRSEVSTFTSAARMLPALAAGEMEVSVGTASAALFNAIAQGAPFRIVADKGQARAGAGYSLLTVRKDLVDSGQVKTVRDLKGRKVAVLARATIQDYLMGKMAEEVGLAIKDFELVFLAGPNQVTAYETKAIDASYAAEPWPARFEEQGLAVKFRTPDQVKALGPVQTGVIIYSGKFIRERRPVAQRWMNAYLKGARFYNERGPKDDEVAAIIEKYTKVPARVVRTAIPHYQDPDGKLVLESLADQIRWHMANGYMPKAVTVDQVVDPTFLK